MVTVLVARRAVALTAFGAARRHFVVAHTWTQPMMSRTRRRVFYRRPPAALRDRPDGREPQEQRWRDVQSAPAPAGNAMRLLEYE
jgi:hypothetical protein